jgi:excisionase family DNA binding protein
MKKLEDLPHFLTPRQAAEIGNFRLSWIYEQTRREALPMAKCGNHVRIPRDEFLDYLRNGSR